jgi:hypothetical protein
MPHWAFLIRTSAPSLFHVRSKIAIIVSIINRFMTFMTYALRDLSDIIKDLSSLRFLNCESCCKSQVSGPTSHKNPAPNFRFITYNQKHVQFHRIGIKDKPEVGFVNCMSLGGLIGVGMRKSGVDDGLFRLGPSCRFSLSSHSSFESTNPYTIHH